MNIKELYEAHNHSSNNREEILHSSKVACFYCLEIFKPELINEWIDKDENGIGQCAVCPNCGIDSVIGDKSGIEFTEEFLKVMQEYWF